MARPERFEVPSFWFVVERPEISNAFVTCLRAGEFWNLPLMLGYMGDNRGRGLCSQQPAASHVNRMLLLLAIEHVTQRVLAILYHHSTHGRQFVPAERTLNRRKFFIRSEFVNRKFQLRVIRFPITIADEFPHYIFGHLLGRHAASIAPAIPAFLTGSDAGFSTRQNRRPFSRVQHQMEQAASFEPKSKIDMRW
jgi:hypothetical protein